MPGVTTTTSGPQVDVVTSPDEAPKSITTTLDGATRTWNFPDGWYVSVYEGKTLADGTIFVLAADVTTAAPDHTDPAGESVATAPAPVEVPITTTA